MKTDAKRFSNEPASVRFPFLHSLLTFPPLTLSFLPIFTNSAESYFPEPVSDQKMLFGRFQLICKLYAVSVP